MRGERGNEPRESLLSDRGGRMSLGNLSVGIGAFEERFAGMKGAF